MSVQYAIALKKDTKNSCRINPPTKCLSSPRRAALPVGKLLLSTVFLPRLRAMTQTALIFGAGTGISASFARLLARNGYKLALAARHPDKLAALAAESGALVLAADATMPDQVAAVFAEVDTKLGPLDVVLYNASARVRGPIAELDPAAVANAINVTAYGGFLVGQQAARRMLKQGPDGKGRGTILFTGASASVKGYPLSATFAMGKFALRGLAQSMARELGPQGIHVAHFVIDGGVRNAQDKRIAGGRVEQPGETPDSLLDPDAIAETYLHVVRQPRSAWTSEVELRPWVERF